MKNISSGRGINELVNFMERCGNIVTSNLESYLTMEKDNCKHAPIIDLGKTYVRFQSIVNHAEECILREKSYQRQCVWIV